MATNPGLLYPWAGHPNYRIVWQPFGPRPGPGPDQAYEPPGFGYAHFHRGVDFAVPSGTQILAAADGTVEFAGWDSTGYGNMVGIKHSGGVATLYAHNASILVSVGQSVTQGQPISVSDSTGNSTAPHLHFGVNALGSVTNDNGWTNPIPALGDAAIQDLEPFGANGVTVDNASVPGYVTLAQAVALARQVGIPEDQVATAAAIADAESSLRIGAVSPKATDGTVGQGLWQIESSHTQYDAKKLTSDPFYNAQAMYDVWHNAPNGGDNWTPWTTYGYVGNPPRFVGWGNGAYKTYLPEAQRAQETTPLGSWPADTPVGVNQTPVNTTPELPVDKIAITPVTPDKSALIRKPGLKPTAGVVINGVTFPAIACQFSEPQYRAAGSWQATLPLAAFDSADGDKALDALFAPRKTQAILTMGFVKPRRNGKPDPRDAPQVFTGLAFTPSIDDSTGVVTLKGPDLSGIFSDQSATASKLQSFMNMPASRAITQIVQRHNATGLIGLVAQIEPTVGNVGGIFGQDAVSTRTPVRTEWDVILQLADSEGMVAYFVGTTLVVQHVPQDGAPVRLYHRVAGKTSLLEKPLFQPTQHSKRDAGIYAYTYDTRQGRIKYASAGNVDSGTVVEIYMPPNQTQDQLQKRANTVAAIYSAMEYRAHLTLASPVATAPNQPIIIQSGNQHRIYKRVMGAHRTYYVVTPTISFDVKAGITLDVLCTNRPPAVQTTTTATSITV